MHELFTITALAASARFLAARLTVIAALATLAGWPGPATADDTFIAVLNSGQEIQTPRPESNAFGNALLTFDKETSVLCYAISYSELEGVETVAHFHGAASAGKNASPLFDISPHPSHVGSPKTGCVGPLQRQERDALRKGLFYINIHSDQYPAGEIRGQVLRIGGARTRVTVTD